MGGEFESEPGNELDDASEAFGKTVVDLGSLRSPVAIGAIGAILIGLAFLIWPDRSDKFVARLVGAAILWLALASIGKAVRTKTMVWSLLPVAVVGLVCGTFLLVRPNQSPVVIGRVVGLWLLLIAARIVFEEVVGRTRRANRVATAGLIAALGFVFTVATESVLAIVFTLVAISCIAVAVFVLVVSLSPRTEGVATFADSARMIGAWFEERPKSVERRQELYGTILFEGPQRAIRIVRFFALMGFASVIASMGVITDSTAVVIGAMLVAPLMTPLMGMAVSLVMGWPNRLSSAAAIAFGGIGFAISIGFFLGLTLPTVIDTATNAQIVARTSPTILDLVVAIAAGAAGAYGLSRPDVSDALPGVAIAISLVPPLAVVGICYSQGDWRSGNGALLLFATNMTAILIVGGLTFIFTGVTPVARAAEQQYRVRTALTVTAAAGLVVLGGLLLNGAQIASDALAKSTVETVAKDWLPDGSPHRLVAAEIDDGVVTATVIGPSGQLPDPAVLADRLSADLDQPIRVVISHVIEERITASSGD